MTRNITPSVTEFDGCYNVGSGSLFRHRKSGQLTTLPNLPLLTLDEIKQISEAAYEIIFQYANQRTYTQEEAREYYSLCISEQLLDRTLNIGFINFDDCTLELIVKLQQFLREQYNSWRIRIAGTSPETTIIIYPSVIRFGSLPINVSVSKAWLTCLQREKEAKGALSDTTRYQHGVLKRILRSTVASFDKRVIIVAGFDNYNGESSKVTLWTICKNSDPDLNLLKPTNCIVGDKFYVKNDGDFGYHVKDNAPYWIKEWIFPSDSRPANLLFEVYDLDYIPTMIEIDIEPTLFAVSSAGE